MHAHSFHSSAPVAGLAADLSVPFVFSPHYHGVGHTPLARVLHFPYDLVGRRLFARADRVLAVSVAEQQLLAEHGRAQNASVVHNAVDTVGIHAAQPYPDQPPTALVLGRLEAYKRVDQVIAAFHAQSGPGRLLVVGDGPERERLRTLADSGTRAADIRIAGRLPRDEVARWLRTCRCVVSMSEHEAFGIVGLEAVAAGATALLSDLPAHREVVELVGGTGARVVAPRDLAEQLASCLDSPSAAPRAVRDWADVVDEHIRLYETVLRTRPSDHQRR